MGKPVTEVARELGIGSGLIYRWINNNGQSNGVSSKATQSISEQTVTDELRGLRRENARLKIENDILKKAAVILGINPQVSNVK